MAKPCFFAMALAKLLIVNLFFDSDQPFSIIADNHITVGDSAQSAYFAYCLQVHYLLS
jgi:hypothetical protein